jgi:hypothetical protein
MNGPFPIHFTLGVFLLSALRTSSPALQNCKADEMNGLYVSEPNAMYKRFLGSLVVLLKLDARLSELRLRLHHSTFVFATPNSYCYFASLRMDWIAQILVVI